MNTTIQVNFTQFEIPEIKTDTLDTVQDIMPNMAHMTNNLTENDKIVLGTMAMLSFVIILYEVGARLNRCRHHATFYFTQLYHRYNNAVQYYKLSLPKYFTKKAKESPFIATNTSPKLVEDMKLDRVEKGYNYHINIRNKVAPIMPTRYQYKPIEVASDSKITIITLVEGRS